MVTPESIETDILSQLQTKEKVSTKELGGEYMAVIGAAKKLEAQERIHCHPVQYEEIALTEEGKTVVQEGSPEYILYALLCKGALSLAEVDQKYRETPAHSGLGEKSLSELIAKGRNNGLKEGIVAIKDGRISQKVEGVTDTVQRTLLQISSKELLAESVAPKELDLLKRRKFVSLKKTTHYDITKGPNFTRSGDLISDITTDMLFSLDLKDRLKKYNFSAVSTPSKFSGALHPLSLEREKMKKIFLEMGFKEMDASKYVESSFWNFDALFQPQRHPSRNEQDTFFLEHPSTAQDPPAEYLKKVEAIHKTGGYGSIGHQAPWSLEESRKNVLRTHTTAVTTRLLHKLAGTEDSGKFFSIDRVFRNESLDATHLAEFHQVEGIILGKGLTISHLMGFLQLFFQRLGIEKLKFKPAFNPYTEPSVEVFAYHEEMQKWMEIGNSGMFRPEMLLPMGFAEDIRVIGWGISLERPVMISRQMKNIRDLVGHKVDLEFIRSGLTANK
ncbi:phenylalanyl-tRNA synthetase alpha chain [Nematocida displodere]|uniref:phenylalanine--tRNA ligase n=1 Tax=Nematocida displodere TaxID=1805483 RepID=A0A177EF80_9MICR|nr:phenylalanyl-tRNA synthetase alpha chain [Nematocida displodere]